MQSDPFRVDKKLAEAARAWLAFRRALRRGEGAEHRFERLGAFASRELVLELRAASASDPFAPALAAWAYRLYLEHGTRELVALRERGFHTERQPVVAPEFGKFTLRELLDSALADAKGARRGFFDALARHAASVTDADQRRSERRLELAVALGDTAPDARPLAGPSAEQRARAFLEATDDAMTELGAKNLGNLVETALGRASPGAWPARLTVRSLAGLLDEANWLDHVALDLEELPRALGASSFLRGLVAFGGALGRALAPTKLPFALAHDPYDLPGATFGSLLALVPFGESFARRKLDVARGRLAEHRRVLARSVLVGARGLALRVLLRAPALAGRRALGEAYPELVFRALRVEVSPHASGALFRSRVSDAERFSGLLAAAERAARLEREHDEDWYRNPRAVDELRERMREDALLVPRDETFERGSRELGTLLTRLL